MSAYCTFLIGAVAAMTDLQGQQVQLFFSTLADAMEHIKAGRIRRLG